MEEQNDQGIFDFDSGNMNGFDNWQKELEAVIEEIRTEWGVPIDKHVRLKLKFLNQEHEGKLKLVQRPLTIDKSQDLLLSVNGMKFVHTDIEFCTIHRRKKLKKPSANTKPVEHAETRAPVVG